MPLIALVVFVLFFSSVISFLLICILDPRSLSSTYLSVIILIPFCFSSAFLEGFSSLSSLELIQIFTVLILLSTASNTAFKSPIALFVPLHYFPILFCNLCILPAFFPGPFYLSLLYHSFLSILHRIYDF